MPTLPRKHGYKRLGTERMYSGIHGHLGSNILRFGGFKLGKIIVAMSEEFVCKKHVVYRLYRGIVHASCLLGKDIALQM